MVLLIVAMLPSLVILLYFDKNLWFSILRVLEVVGMTALAVSVMGMFFSSLTLKTSTATAWTYGVVIVLGVLAMVAMLEPFSQRLVLWVYQVNPIAAALDAAGNDTMQKMGVVARYLWIAAAATACMAVVTVARVFQLRRAS